MSLRKAGLVVPAVLVAVAMALLCGEAFAQDAKPAAQGGGGTNFFVIFFLSGGGVLGVLTTLPIVGCSIASVALIIQFLVQLQRDKIAPPEVIVQIEELIEQEQYDEALNICDATKNYVTSIVGAALLKVEYGYDSMVEAAASAAEEENMKLQHKIGWLLLLGNVAPMMGLFGTVIGMVSAFTEIATSSESPSPQQLAGGIYTALITTVWGLLVAIPSLTAYFLFKNKVQKITAELLAVSSEIIERFRPVAQGK